jgi:septal ring-binding cell division protein DamX
MRRRVLELQKRLVRRLAIPALVVILSIGSIAPSFAQSSESHAQDQGKQTPPNAADAAKENQRKIDEFAEAAQAINGPAGNPECVWLGRRVVQLMYRDDLDTAFRHLDLYDRFGCPGGHVQAAFRCLTRFFAQIDDKVPNSLSNHVHACWINPNAQPQAAAAPAASQPATAGSAPTPTASPQPAPAAQPAAK